VGGSSYNLTLANGNVGAGDTLTIEASGLTSSDTLKLYGAAVSSGNLDISAGAGNDTLIGGGGTNTFDGGLGADKMTAGSGVNYFQYNSVAESTSTGFDTIVNFNASNDKFMFLGAMPSISGIDATVTSGTLGATHFDIQLAQDIGASQLGIHEAVLFTPTAGTYAGDTFLVVDVNGVAGYQAGQDLLVELSHATNLGSLSTANFII
jgi:Ca2+-binding RTX toxin-like protein